MVFHSIYSLSSYYSILGTISFLLTHPVSSAFRDSLSSPIDKKNNKFWHWTGFLLRASITLIACPFKFLPVYAFYFWIVFDGMYNLNTCKSWWYTGVTAATDIKTGKYNHLIKWVGLGVSMVFTLIIL